MLKPLLNIFHSNWAYEKNIYKSIMQELETIASFDEIHRLIK